MADPVTHKEYTECAKCYKNADFLNSGDARYLRILCEYEEPLHRLAKNGVKATVLVFGSARSKSTAQYTELLKQLNETRAAMERGETVESDIDHRLAKGIDKSDKMAVLEAQVERLNTGFWMCEYFDKTTELCRRLTEFAMLGTDATKGQRFQICTGGGPGFMEAANRGAAMVPGATNVGMGISLPFESHINKYVTDELAFEYHYFFTRKFWMVYNCHALIVAPGGVGTMDELFEILNLKETGKIAKDLPVVLFGKTFWTTIVNWEALIRFGELSQEDYDSMCFTDSEDEAFQFVTERLAVSAPHVPRG